MQFLGGVAVDDFAVSKGAVLQFGSTFSGKLDKRAGGFFRDPVVRPVSDRRLENGEIMVIAETRGQFAGGCGPFARRARIEQTQEGEVVGEVFGPLPPIVALFGITGGAGLLEVFEPEVGNWTRSR